MINLYALILVQSKEERAGIAMIYFFSRKNISGMQSSREQIQDKRVSFFFSLGFFDQGVRQIVSYPTSRVKHAKITDIPFITIKVKNVQTVDVFMVWIDLRKIIFSMSPHHRYVFPGIAPI